MLENNRRFYTTGGTLGYDAPSYISRHADEALLDGLGAGRFCYVLTSRQVGKSSLMVRTAVRLRATGTRVAVLDLTSVGQSVAPEQWYNDLMLRLAEQLDLEDALEDFITGDRTQSPMGRWVRFLEKVVLPQRPSPLVIFVDEVDVVRSLPFSTDEFFAAIRELHNRRSLDPELQRLTFCLLGVATPSDLIRDPRTTPFNIGMRIELQDFTQAEALPLASNLHPEPALASRLLRRILYWTGGHPYLTQRLCDSVSRRLSDSAHPTTPSIREDGQFFQTIDSECRQIFLQPGFRLSDDNLQFVRDRLLRSELGVANMLEAYQLALSWRAARYQESSAVQSGLLLSGIVRLEGGRLRVRNRIYRRVFTRKWIDACMPDAVLRARRRGFWRGVLITGISITILSAVTWLAVLADHRRQEAEGERETNRMLLYDAQMNLAMQAWESGNVGHLLELLKAHRPITGQRDLRHFEWYYLKRLTSPRGELVRGIEAPTGFALSPDGALIAVATERGRLGIWDAVTGALKATFPPHPAKLLGVTFSPDGARLATACQDNLVRLWDIQSQRLVYTYVGHTEYPEAVAISPDGETLVSAGHDATIRLWSTRTGTPKATLRGHTGAIIRVIFSPDGRNLLSASLDGTVRIWDAQAPRELKMLVGHQGWVFQVAISPDGKIMASGGVDAAVRLWRFESGCPPMVLRGHAGPIVSLAFSPDGRTLASGGRDTLLKLWSVDSGEELRTLRGHEWYVGGLAFTPDGKRILSRGDEGSVREWRLDGGDPDIIRDHSDIVTHVAFSPDGRLLASASRDGTILVRELVTNAPVLQVRTGIASADPKALWGDVTFSPDGHFLAGAGGTNSELEPMKPGILRIWDLRTGSLVTSLTGHTGAASCLSFSRDGRRLVSGSWDKQIRQWEIGSRRLLSSNTDPVEYVSAVTYSPDGSVIASFDQNGSVFILDSQGLKTIKRWKAHVPGAGAAAFSSRGDLLATAGYDGVVRLWDTTSWRLIRELPHGARIRSLCFSRDGRRLIAGTTLSTVQMWDLESGREVITLRGHKLSVQSVAITPDGRTIASGSNDNTVRLWRTAAGE